MAGTEDTALTARQRYWLQHLKACEISGQTTIDYARAHGLKVKSLYAARKALAEKGRLPPAPNQFQRVRVTTGPTTGVDPGQWQVQLPNGAAVAFTGEVDPRLLSLVLTTAARLP